MTVYIVSFPAHATAWTIREMQILILASWILWLMKNKNLVDRLIDSSASPSSLVPVPVPPTPFKSVRIAARCSRCLLAFLFDWRRESIVVRVPMSVHRTALSKEINRCNDDEWKGLFQLSGVQIATGTSSAFVMSWRVIKADTHTCHMTWW